VKYCQLECFLGVPRRAVAPVRSAEVEVVKGGTGFEELWVGGSLNLFPNRKELASFSFLNKVSSLLTSYLS